jgi:hypothetical protein
MNEKIFYAKKSIVEKDDAQAKLYEQKANAAYDNIQQLTAYYNTTIAKGKWNGIMSAQPRNANVCSV